MSLLVKILGLADLAAAAVLFTAKLHWIPSNIIGYIAFVLFLKGVIFISDPVSKFDIVIAAYIGAMLLLFDYSITPLSIIFGLYIGFKGLYSLF